MLQITIITKPSATTDSADNVGRPSHHWDLGLRRDNLGDPGELCFLRFKGSAFQTSACPESPRINQMVWHSSTESDLRICNGNKFPSDQCWFRSHIVRTTVEEHKVGPKTQAKSTPKSHQEYLGSFWHCSQWCNLPSDSLPSKRMQQKWWVVTSTLRLWDCVFHLAGTFSPLQVLYLTPLLAHSAEANWHVVRCFTGRPTWGRTQGGISLPISKNWILPTTMQTS